MIMDVELRLDGTENGIHKYLSWLKCPRKAWLEEKYKKEREENTLSDKKYFIIGTLIHALLAAHYKSKKTLDVNKLCYVFENGEKLDRESYYDEIISAETLYQSYTSWTEDKDFKNIICVEKDFETILEGPNSEIPITVGIDLMVTLSEEELESMELIGEPGTYIVDHKSSGARDDKEFEMAAVNPQFTTYLWVMSKLGYNPKGLIVNILDKKRKPQHRRLLIPNEVLLQEWKYIVSGLIKRANYLKESWENVYSSIEIPTEPLNCFKKVYNTWDVCKFYSNNTCDRRYNK